MGTGSKQLIGPIISGVCVLIAAVVGILWFILGTEDVPIILRNAQTQERITGRIYVDGSNNAIDIDPDSLEIKVPLKRGQHKIQAESHGYKPETKEIDRLEKPINISLTQLKNELVPEPPDSLTPVPLIGWNLWPSTALTVTRGPEYNILIINSNRRLADSDGINFSNMSLLRGKTLIMEFANTDKSVFPNDRMMKLGKRDKTALKSSNIDLLEGEYLPAISNMPMEIIIPDTFDGFLDFIFYQAELKDLKITAYYK